MWKIALTKKFVLQFLNLTTDGQKFIMGWLGFMRDLVGEMKFEFDIIDEYSSDVEHLKMPVNYHQNDKKKILYILSLNPDGIDQHVKEQYSSLYRSSDQ